MMMRDATTVLEAGFSRSVLNIFVNVNNFFHRDFVVLDGEINVDGSPSFVKLCDSETYEHVFSFLSVVSSSVENRLTDILAERSNLRPWA